jgi:hypothetical protein
MRTRRPLARITVAAVLAAGTLAATVGTADAEAPEHCRTIHSAIKNWGTLADDGGDTWGEWIYYQIMNEYSIALGAEMGC